MSYARADQILRVLQRRHPKELFFGGVKNGPTWTASELLIMDAVAIRPSWTRPLITGYEVKVTHQDFARDAKWPRYLELTHRFYFACPKGVIQPEELDARVGLVWIDPETGGWSVRKAAPYRDIEMPWPMIYYLLISRTAPDRHPFFSSQRELLEAWVADRADRKALALVVRTKLVEERDAALKRAQEAEAEVERLREKAERWDRVAAILKARGFRLWDWDWDQQLVKALSAGVTPKLLSALRSAASEIQEALRALGEAAS